MKKTEIEIGNKIISESSRSFIIAEAGVNYYDVAQKRNIGLLEAAELMIREAAKAGADAVKFQIYKAEKLASKFSPAYWDISKEPTKSQYELFKKFDKLTNEDYSKLADCCKKHGVVFIATPFDEDAVELTDKLSPVFKIASADITNFPLLKKIAKKGKPVLLSTGASKLEEIKEAVELIKQNGSEKIALLHCVLNYPTDYENANLKRIYFLRRTFPDNIIGYSDHTLPDENMLVLGTAFLLGARIIEKHFTLDKTLQGNDHYHAMDPSDLKKFTETLGFLQKISGREDVETEKEADAIKYARRSIVAKNKMSKGSVITEQDIEIKRPGTGISPKFLQEILNKKLKKDLEQDQILTWEDIEK